MIDDVDLAVSCGDRNDDCGIVQDIDEAAIG